MHVFNRRVPQNFDDQTDCHRAHDCLSTGDSGIHTALGIAIVQASQQFTVAEGTIARRGGICNCLLWYCSLLYHSFRYHAISFGLSPRNRPDDPYGHMTAPDSVV
jgi:hypothetical protein